MTTGWPLRAAGSHAEPLSPLRWCRIDAQHDTEPLRRDMHSAATSLGACRCASCATRQHWHSAGATGHSRLRRRTWPTCADAQSVKRASQARTDGRGSPTLTGQLSQPGCQPGLMPSPQFSELLAIAWGWSTGRDAAGHPVQISASLPGENRAGQLQLQFDDSLEGVSQRALGSSRSPSLPVVPRFSPCRRLWPAGGGRALGGAIRRTPIRSPPVRSPVGRRSLRRRGRRLRPPVR